MTREPATVVAYWDASAVVAALFNDPRSDEARELAAARGAHLLSSLAWAETHAVIARVEREHGLTGALAEAARDALEAGPWRRVNVAPPWSLVRSLAQPWPLRGADLWHLSAAKAMQADLPELQFVTFDARLSAAAHGEGLR